MTQSNATGHDAGERVAWHAHSPEEALEKLKSGVDGLSPQEAQARLERHGPNRLPPPAKRGPLLRFLLQFHNVLIYVLIGAGVVTGLLQHWIDTGVIFGVVVINALVGFFQEGKAERALDAISKMLSLEATVVRDGKREAIPAEKLVPGDVVVLHPGDKVPADVRLIEAREFRVDEAILTGESVPTEKNTGRVDQGTSLGDQKSMAFSGTLVTTGQAVGLVVATGRETQIGQISQLVNQTQTITTPVIAQMARLGTGLAVFICALAGLTFGFGYLVHDGSPAGLFMATVALAVAAIPEGLPAIVTIVLAIGVQRMAGRNAIIRRLPAVDTLGALSVICSDKTGTLTRNEMTVTAVVTADRVIEVTGAGYEPTGGFRVEGKETRFGDRDTLTLLARAGLLCNESDLVRHDGLWAPQGDPMESALIVLAMKAGLDAEAERYSHETLDTIPFETRHRYMASLHRAPGSEAPLLVVKGAPEQVLLMCDRQMQDGGPGPIDRAFWEKSIESQAAQGRRVLALALGDTQAGKEEVAAKDVQERLILLGMVGIIDPPREEAVRAVARCQEAGIRVVMITGDHALTARAIGKELGIGNCTRAMTGQELDTLDPAGLSKAAGEIDVFARVSPEHKLRLVVAIQSLGNVAAMTGDGVNDAPALKRADVGIAMGVKGTEAAKEAAEMVLADDNFASIAHAVEEGRAVYDNLRKAILFILPTNGGQAFTILAPILLGRTLPLTPVQVLWVNMVTAVTLALALAFEPPESDVMRRPPRDRSAGLLDAYFLWRIGFVSVLMCAATFGMFIWMRDQGMSEEIARTVAINTMVMCEAFYLFNIRYIHGCVLSIKGLFGSRPVLIAIGLVLMLQALLTYAPFMNTLFGTAPLTLEQWLWLTAVASLTLFVVELEKAVVRRLSGV